VTLTDGDPARLREAEKELRGIDGIKDVRVESKPVCPEPGAVAGFLGLGGRKDGLPEGDVFRPLLADPKQPRFFVSYNSYDSSVERYAVGSAGYGETFGLYRWGDRGNGLQLSITGGLFAQFNLDSESHDLVNADYTIGGAATYRRGANSARLRLYHQSSHLGDEYLLRVKPQRVNLSYESAELIYSREFETGPHMLRGYAGGEYLLRREPAELDQGIVHWGVEYAGKYTVLKYFRLVGGVDMKSFEEHKWSVDTSVKAGLQLGESSPGERRMRFMGQWYKGFDPHGQFYRNRIEYYGFEVSLGF
jgi:hypothetical protein